MQTPPVVCVTGASAGIGRAIALAFAAEWGASIGLIARSREALEEVAREVERLGGQPLVLPLDVADEAAVSDAADRVERELGPIDVWVNDAMVTVFGRVEHLKPEELRRVTEVTYLGSAFGIQAALRHMIPRGGERSSKLVRHWHTARSLSRRPTAAPRPRSEDLSTVSVPNCFTTAMT